MLITRVCRERMKIFFLAQTKLTLLKKTNTVGARIIKKKDNIEMFEITKYSRLDTKSCQFNSAKFVAVE
jgi:ferritin-like metal-binding protein YciE